MRNLRRFIAALVLLAPAIRFWGVDLASRAGRLSSLDRPHLAAYAASAFGSVVFWLVLLAASARRRGPIRHLGAAVFVGIFGVVSTVVGGFHHLFGIYPSRESMEDSGSWIEAGLAGLPARPAIVGCAAGSVIAAVLLVWRRGAG